MLLKRGIRKALAFGSAFVKRPFVSGGLLSSRVSEPRLQHDLLFDKDGKDKKEDEDEVDEQFRKKSMKEELNDFWKDPKKRNSLLAALLLLTGITVTSKKFRDIMGLDFGFYKTVSLAVM